MNGYYLQMFLTLFILLMFAECRGIVEYIEYYVFFNNTYMKI